MKKCISIILTIVFCLIMAVSASAADVTANAGGYSGVEFSDGYIGFCIDANLKGADNGQNFTKSDSTSSATNNNTQADVSQQLKALFIVNFNEMFVADGNDGYELDGLKVDSSIQSAVWNITDGRYVWGESKTFAEAAKSYDGAEIPDEGYSLQLDNGDVVTFSFIVVEPHQEGYQAFFALKISISDEPTHTHDYDDEWSSDDENHWHECDCGDKADEDGHTLTEADCKNPSECSVCGKVVGGTDSENHTGETVVKNQKPATETEAGYTGDIHCAGCDELLESGEIIAPTHTHDYDDEWSSDDENHWHECGCGDKVDEDEHSFFLGTCSVCGYGKSPEMPDGFLETCGNIVLGIVDSLSEADFGAIDFGTIDFDATDFGTIDFGDIDFGNISFGGEDNGEDDEINEEIPDTGSDSTVVWAFVLLVMSVCTVAVMSIRRKKRCINK